MKEEYKAKKIAYADEQLGEYLRQAYPSGAMNLALNSIISDLIDEMASANNTGGYPNIQVPCVFENSPRERAAYRLGYYDHQDNFWDNLSKK